MYQEEQLRSFGAVIMQLLNKQDITREQARDCWRQICEETQPDLQQGAFLGALKAKGETPAEIAGAFDALYEYDTAHIEVDTPTPVIDNAGTGADSLKTLNISTGAAIIAAACGVYVMRHASRAITSHCGAIDVTEALGVNVESAPELPKKSIENAGIGVWNALLPTVHPKTLGRLVTQIRYASIINLVGPLLNPTMLSYKVLGVASIDMLDTIAELLRELKLKRAFVVHGTEESSSKGMDELSTLGPSHVAELRPDGTIDKYVVTPSELGLKQTTYEHVASTRAVDTDALALVSVIAGKDDGPRTDIICLNAAAIMYVMGQVDELRSGIDKARETIASGAALSKLRDWVTWQNATPEAGMPTLEALLKRVSS